MEKIILDENEMPKSYYNILPDLPEPLAPPLHPATNKPIRPEDLAAILSKEAVRQEMSMENFIPIPEEVRDALLAAGRPTPLFRVYCPKAVPAKHATPASS
ncbi:MAG: hypothetical protein QW275_00585, partial [Candidatus Anstonellaceae archaeon]